MLAFTTGIAGGFGHCIGMCGPLIASQSLSFQRTGAGRLMTPHALYNIGRIITYGLIGALMGLTGSFMNIAGRLAGIQNSVLVIAGLTMMLMGISIIWQRGATGWIEGHNSTVLRAARHILSSRSSFRPLGLGLVMGLLPCGLSYTIFIAAAGTGSSMAGMLMALAFGIGTAPALLLFGTAVSSLRARLRGRIYQAGGVLVILMGILFLVRGIRLYAGL